jgi:hypothetical protein
VPRHDRSLHYGSRIALQNREGGGLLVSLSLPAR